MTVATADWLAVCATNERELDDAAVRAFAHDAKIGLLGTVSPEGLPHLTLITSLQAKGPSGLMFGQFTEGSSKHHVQLNPRTGFLVMSTEREIWHGKARWRNVAKAGKDYELYNHKPLFRYNAYFGVHTVHYLDIVELADKESLSIPRMMIGGVATAVVQPFTRTGNRERILTTWAETHISKLKTMKFPCYVGDDGYPVVMPPVACRAVDSRRLVFTASGRHRDLADLTEGRTIAVLALSLEMESVLVRGRFGGFQRRGGVTVGSIDIDWVYNSMPPKQGPIYPPEPLEPVTDFDASGS